jgi:uncharacterized membrane protein
VFFAAALLNDTLVWAGIALAAIALPLLIRQAEWRALTIPLRQHLLFASLLFLVVLWMISVRTFEGIWLHFLGVTAVTLLVGLRFTLLVGGLACAIHALLIEQPLAVAPIAWLVSVVCPASLSRLLVYWLRRRPQSNLFIYLLGAGFGGGVLAALGTAVLSLFVLLAAGHTDRVTAALETWPLITLIMFPEGFINGMVLSVIVVLNPEAVKTFDSDKYMGEG